MQPLDLEQTFSPDYLLGNLDENLVDPKDTIKRMVMMALDGWLASPLFEATLRGGGAFKVRVQGSVTKPASQFKQIEVSPAEPVKSSPVPRYPLGSKWKTDNLPGFVYMLCHGPDGIGGEGVSLFRDGGFRYSELVTPKGMYLSEDEWRKVTGGSRFERAYDLIEPYAMGSKWKTSAFPGEIYELRRSGVWAGLIRGNGEHFTRFIKSEGGALTECEWQELIRGMVFEPVQDEAS